MKIRKGMEEKYSEWLKKRKSDSHGKMMVEAVHSAGEALDKGRHAGEVLKMVLNLKRSSLPAEKMVQVALAISVLHERGDALRFEWNKYYKGEDWALDMEISEKRLHNPL